MPVIIPTRSGPLSRFLAWYAARGKRLQRDAWVREIAATTDTIEYLANRRAELKTLLRGLK